MESGKAEKERSEENWGKTRKTEEKKRKTEEKGGKLRKRDEN